MTENARMRLSTILAVMAPLAHFAGVGYMAVLLAAGSMLPLTILGGTGLRRISKPEAVLEWLWIGLVLGSVMSVAGANWPGDRSEIVVPLTLLAISAIAGDTEKSERGCTVLFWAAAVPAILIAGVLIGKMELTWLAPEPRKWSAGLIVALLFPALNGTETGNGIKTGLLTALVAGFLALLIQGGLGINTGEAEISPLYQLGRCVGNGGFEILISIVLTLGWYGFASMGMRAAESFGNKIALTSRQSRIGTAVIAAAFILAEVKIEDGILITGCLLLWVLVPILHPKK